MEERVNAELKVVLDQMPELIINKEQMPFIQQSFKEMIEMNKSVPNPAVTITDRLIPGPSREQEIRIRIYRSEAPTQLSAGLLWIHGGGYVLG
ncbi:alpha/beta hydrolase, partial [Heyndrickxia oleronia]